MPEKKTILPAESEAHMAATQAELMDELTRLRRRVEELESSEIAHEKTEEGLRETEQRLRSLVETANGWIWEVDTDGVYTYASPKVRDLLGYEPEEVVGKGPFDFMPPEEAGRVAPIFDEISQRVGPFSGLENINIRKDGRRITLETSGVPILDREGNLSGYAGIDRDITIRKRAIDDLKQAEEKYRTIFENTTEGIFRVTPEGRHLSVNPALARMFGFNSPEEMTETVTDIGRQLYVNPRDREQLKSLLAETGAVEGFEAEVRRQDGQSFWLSINAHIVRDSEGNTLYYEGTNSDITERKRVEKALRDSELKYREFVDLLPQPVVELDEECNFKLVNTTALEAFGYGREEFERGVSVFQTVAPEDRERMRANIERRLRGEDLGGSEYTMMRKDGSRFPVLVYSSPIVREERILGMRVIAVDITTQKRTEEELRENESRIRAITESARDGIIMMDSDGMITYWNEAAGRIFGYTPAEAVGHELHRLLAPAKYRGSYRAGLERFRPTGEGGAIGQSLELTALRKDGTEFPVELSLAAVHMQHRWVAVGIVRDITDRKRDKEKLQSLLAEVEEKNRELHRANEELKASEKGLVQSEKLASLGQLSAGIAHELKNPLGIILQGMAYIRSTMDNETLIDACGRIERSAIRANTIIQSLLDFARQRPPALKEVALRTLVEGILVMVEHQMKLKNVLIIRDFPPIVYTVNADANQMEQVLINLLVNASDAMKDGGTITVSIGPGAAADGTPWVEMTVADTGTGIPEEVLPRVFDPFFTTKEAGKGTGLGLSVTKGIVEHHGGRITMSSKAGEGTTVKIGLPCNLPERRMCSMDKKKILLIDDEDDFCFFAKLNLEKGGDYEVFTATSGMEGLRLAKEKKPDLIILDVIMPEMDGGQVAEALLRDESTSGIPVVFLTAVVRKEEVSEHGGRIGGKDFIAKPVTAAKLMESIEHYLGKG